MKNWALALPVVCALANEGVAKDYNAPLDLPPGAKIDLTIQRSGSGTGTEVLAGKTLTFRYRQDLTPTPQGYRVHQTLTGMDIPPGLDPAARMGIEQSAIPSRETSYEADQSLTPIRIVNWEAQLATMFDTMTKMAGPAGRMTVETTRQQFSRLTPEQGATLLKEQNMVAIAQGLTLDLNTPVSIDTRMTNPLGGGPIKAKLSVTLDRFDRAANTAQIHIHQELDPESASRSAREIVLALASHSPVGKNKPDEATLAGLKIENTLECHSQIDTVTGLATQTSCVSTTTGADQHLKPRTRIDRWGITQMLVR